MVEFFVHIHIALTFVELNDNTHAPVVGDVVVAVHVSSVRLNVSLDDNPYPLNASLNVRYVSSGMKSSIVFNVIPVYVLVNGIII